MEFSNAYYVYWLEYNNKVCHVICNIEESKLNKERFVTVNGEQLSSTDRSYIISWIHSHYELDDIDIRTADEVTITSETAGVKRRVRTLGDLKW